MNKRFIFLSPMYGADEHLIFEIGCISLLFHKYPHAYVEFIGDDAHCEQIKTYSLFGERMHFIKVPYYNRYLLIFLSCIISWFKKGNLVVLSTENLVYFFLFFRKVYLFFPHTFYKEKPFFLKRIAHFLIFKFFLFFHPGASVVFLGEWIYLEVILDKKFSLREKKQFKWINHPYEGYSYPIDDFHQSFSGEIAFGLLGRISAQKGFMSSDVDYIVKAITKQKGVVLKTSLNNFVSLSQFLSKLKSSHYVVLLSHYNSYQFRCSGLFIESIMNNKPVICIRNPMTTYFFSKYGNIGYICNNLTEMAETIDYIFKYGHKCDYSSQINNLEKIAKSFNNNSSIIF